MKKLLELLVAVNEYVANEEGLKSEIKYVSESGNIEIIFSTEVSYMDKEKMIEEYEKSMYSIQFDPSDETMYLWNDLKEEYKTINGIDELKMVLNFLF